MTILPWPRTEQEAREHLEDSSLPDDGHGFSTWDDEMYEELMPGRDKLAIHSSDHEHPDAHQLGHDHGIPGLAEAAAIARRIVRMGGGHARKRSS